jgi:hypothetical protein
MSPSFYAQLLHAQIPKAQKKTVKLSVFFALWGSVRVKVRNKMLAKSTLVSISSMFYEQLLRL